MARKRMFDYEIINQDSFFDLSMEAMAIYFLLGMHADDEGNVISCDRDGGKNGYRLYSVSKWTVSDSTRLARLVTREFEAKNYDIYWDDVAMFKYPDQFNLTVHKVGPKDITEIDSLDELKALDPSYQNIGE